MSESVTEILIKAKELITGHWGQGRFFDKKTKCYCAQGAIQQAFSALAYRELIIHEAGALMNSIDYFKEAMGIESIPAWNDRFGRTEEEVLLAFDKAIEYSKNGRV